MDRNHTTALTPGRHRYGLPGLVHVSEFVTVTRRGFFSRLFRPGRHRMFEVPAVTTAGIQPSAATV